MRTRALIASALSLLALLWSTSAGAKLTITNLAGFNPARAPIVNLTIAADTNNYNVCSAIQATGINPAILRDGTVNISMGDMVGVGSTSTATPAMVTGNCGSSWAPGWTVNILVPTGIAGILGKGGDGGSGRQFDDTVFINYGGGGGGGAGTLVGAGGAGGTNGFTNPGANGTSINGGAGGTFDPFGSPVSPATSGGNGGIALQATSGGPNVFLRPALGATLLVWGGGGGGGGGGGNGAGQSTTGGTGGSAGADGSAGSGTSPGAGGTHGVCCSTPGAATITDVGPGTISRLGV